MKLQLTLLASALLIFTHAVMAADVATMTLENGAKVRLKDDFTWEYILTETHTPDVAVAAPVAATVTTAPTVSAQAAPQVASAAIPAVAETRLTATAIARPELLGTTEKSDIRVSYASSQWKGDRLGITFDFTSNSNEHVTLVEVEASFFSDAGVLLKTEKLNAWEAIFRMPETYLRNGQTRQNGPIWVDGIDPAQWTQHLMSLKITDIDSR